MENLTRVIENLVYAGGLVVATCVICALFGYDLPSVIVGVLK